MGEAAKAVSDYLDNGKRIIYINVMNRLSIDCDCDGNPAEPDIHDIGKNIVKVILENYNFRVLDLGKDVPPERIVAEVKRNGIRIVGLSALMTTTVAPLSMSARNTPSSVRTSRGCSPIVGSSKTNRESDCALPISPASFSLWASPPERLAPPSPTIVSNP